MILDMVLIMDMVTFIFVINDVVTVVIIVIIIVIIVFLKLVWIRLERGKFVGTNEKRNL